MATHTAVGEPDRSPGPGECWCCGRTDDPARLVHLGLHPEVSLCPGCARWAAKEAWEIEDLGRTGPLVMARDQARAVRRAVIERGWHRSPLLGGPLRWLGKRMP